LQDRLVKELRSAGISTVEAVGESLRSRASLGSPARPIWRGPGDGSTDE